MNPDAKNDPVGSVTEARYMPYKMVADLEGGQRVIDMLQGAGINAQADPKFEWVHDTFLIVIRMFPHCIPLPTTIVSMNARYDPHLHTKIGAALRPLRYEDTLIIGSGGSVHNLYRTIGIRCSPIETTLRSLYHLVTLLWSSGRRWKTLLHRTRGLLCEEPLLG